MENTSGFIQQCLASKMFTEDEFVSTTTRFFGDEIELNKIIQETKKTLVDYGLDLAKIIDQVTGDAYYVLTNNKQDTLATLASKYTQTELLYFKSLVEGIMTSDDNKFYLTYHEALDKSGEIEVATFRSKEAQTALDSFFKDKWLESVSGKICLGNRSLAELHKFLKDNYNEETTECYVCSGILTRGWMCHYCGKGIHSFCYNQLSTNQNKECLECSKDFDQNSQENDSVVGPGE
ncbi:hypothetical protein BB559_000460 [Furculomyces boomerangus]|uniref:Non-structural maintenance of chromosomes element 1 homolog n=1 Tax=Furculomyces boomerangus TaxID=61424 RepID=A0A2T9Z545_9FUNG|nr:hypothetical protein BB559_000460 [Furculomyces boomerangus]